jgi:sarcosine oxidase
MAIYDFIIVGLGTAGSATCMVLARRGYKVLGIDAYDPPHHFGSHHGATRSVRRAYLEGTAYVPMTMKSWELWQRLEKDTGKTLLIPTGNLTIARTDAPALKGFVESAQAFNIPHEYLTGAEVKKRWPQLSVPDHFSAGLEKEAGIVFPELSISTFLSEADKAGADLITGQRVERWVEKENSITAFTSQGRYEAGRLLIAAGAFSSQLPGHKQGILTPKRVPVFWIDPPERKSYELGEFPVNFWQIPIETDSDAFTAFQDEGCMEFYTLPVAGTSPWVKAAFHNGLETCHPGTINRQVTKKDTIKIQTVLSRFLPGLAHGPVSSEVCMYTMTPDNEFYLGQLPDSKHLFGAALAGHGFKFAPVLGEILADLLTDVEPEFDLTLFSPNRFASKLQL